MFLFEESFRVKRSFAATYLFHVKHPKTEKVVEMFHVKHNFAAAFDPARQHG